MSHGFVDADKSLAVIDIAESKRNPIVITYNYHIDSGIDHEPRENEFYLALAYDAPKCSMRISPPPSAYSVSLYSERTMPNLLPICSVLSGQALVCIHCCSIWRKCCDPPAYTNDGKRKELNESIPNFESNDQDHMESHFKP